MPVNRENKVKAKYKKKEWGRINKAKNNNKYIPGDTLQGPEGPRGEQGYRGRDGDTVSRSVIFSHLDHFHSLPFEDISKIVFSYRFN